MAGGGRDGGAESPAERCVFHGAAAAHRLAFREATTGVISRTGDAGSPSIVYADHKHVC